MDHNENKIMNMNPSAKTVAKNLPPKEKWWFIPLRHRPIQAFLFSLFLAALGGSHFL
jgi:hypothetical protein